MNKDEWFLVPYRTHVRENLPYITLCKERNHTSPRLKGVIAILQYLGDGLYCEISVNKARDSIKLIPQRKQTAYSRNIRTDFGSHIQIGGGATLINDLNMKIGIYKMVSVNPLVFKYAGLK